MGEMTLVTAIRKYKEQVPQLGNDVYIDRQAAVIGAVKLGDDCSVWPMAVIRGDVNYIEIGSGCSIQDGAVLHVTHDGPFTAGGRPLILGNGITVGHKAVLHACTIADYCLIGMGAVVLDEVEVEHHVLIAAGTVVPPGKRLLSGHLYLGNPAKLIRALSTAELAQLEYSAAHYIRLKNIYLLEN